MMTAELMFIMLPGEGALVDQGDYWQLIGELSSKQKCLQGVEGQEKTRRLVYGEGNTS